MAAKRFSDESGSDPNGADGKRRRTKPSFASVIGEAVMMNSLEHLCGALEPVLRRVVNEEVEQGLRRGIRSITRSHSLRIQAPEPSGLRLKFSNDLLLPKIFTGSKILDFQENPLHVLLMDTTGDRTVPTSLPYPIKVEIVVLDGDLPGDSGTWTSEEFEKNIVRQRTGKRPLLAGELVLTMRNGAVPVGDIEFTDNSSWIRCRKFRLGARVLPANTQGVGILEAMTEAFVVKDHRGELYKKHHPPMLDDEVWRLEKIGKDGAFHKRLSSSGIATVQDFLKLSVADPSKLRKILGSGMSEKMWEVTITHARTCSLGNKHYIFRGRHYTIILNPICQVVKVMIEGQPCSPQHLASINKGYVENLVRDAFANWNSLDEIEGVPKEIPLPTQDLYVTDQYPNHHHHSTVEMKSFQHNGYYLPDKSSSEVGYIPSSTNTPVESTYWLMHSATPVEGGVRYVSDSSDGDLNFISGS